MRLKKLELQGYKTFASRAEFFFESGITAIVGPNGSGKSNIADAIRWVLGEQSFRLLRGKKTEDMIFAGSQKRARAGMAQATILLDNEDGVLPVEFSEVAVGRRAYRSGENEYILNGSRVRLRDTSELLSSSGLGQRTYNVIGQGLVDAALALRADERRALFEEAAGIALYKDRREESLRRLEETQRNLERVLDILNEIRPQMRRLKRQAERSQEYDQVKTDLENLLYLWYGYHWEVAKRQLRLARTEAQDHAASLQAVQEEQLELEEALGRYRQQSSQLRAQLGDWHRQNSHLHRQAEQIQRNLAVRSERLRMLGQQQEELRAEIVPLQQQKEQAAAQLAEAQAVLDRANAHWQEQRQAVAESRETLHQQRNEVSRLRDQEQKAQRLWIRLEEQAGSLEKRRQELARDQAKLAAEQETEAETLTQQLAEQVNAQQELDNYQTQLKGLEEQASALEQKHSELRDQRQTSQAKLEQLNAQQQPARAQLTQLEAQHRALSDLRDRGVGHDTAVQKLLTSADRPDGIIGPVSQLMEVPAELELAIAAALGADLSALVVSNWQVAGQILTTVGSDSRVSLFPLNELRPSRPLGAPSNAQVIGVASELVTCQSTHRPVVNLLLGHVLVVQDLATARRLAPELPAGACAVTPTGLIVMQDGRILQSGRDTGKSLLAQEREWRALPAQLARASDAVQSIESARTAERDQLQSLENALESLVSQAEQMRQQQRAVNRDREAARLQYDRLTQNIAWHRERQKEMAQRAQAQTQEMVELVQSQQAVKVQQEQLYQQHQQLKAELAAAHAPINDLSAELAARERALAQTEGAHQNQQALVETHRNTLHQTEQQLDSRRERIQSIDTERTRLTKQMSTEREQERELAEQISVVDQRITPAENRLSEVELQLEKLQKDEDALRRRVRQVEQAANRAQLMQDRQENQLEHLRSRIQEELGLVHLPLDEDIAGQTPLPLGEMVGQLPVVRELPTDLESSIQRRRQQLRRMGAINPNAPAEYRELEERHTFLQEQVNDLHQADQKLRQVIEELDEVMEREFKRTFQAVAAEFREAFTRLFGGGSARLILTDPDNPIESGVEIIARPPGRRQQGLALLSGGERSLTAAALIFALLKVSPTPFCVLDEVDAMLDEANVGRFRDMLKELSQQTQFIVITHNRGTVQAADTIYGISMGEDGTSQVISLRLEGDQLAEKAH